jgi:L-lactate dehydrogenase complex protein LldE
MLRELRISEQPRRLLRASGAELVPFARPDLCCGFGGTFSVRQPEVSLAMADDKLTGSDGATIVTADPGCLMHLRGRAECVGGRPRVVHLASALARGARA